jgi:hypothetical protein
VAVQYLCSAAVICAQRIDFACAGRNHGIQVPNVVTMDGNEQSVSNFDGEAGTRFLETAQEIYDKVDFKSDALFNKPAPEPWVAFMIGGVSSYF